MDKFEKHKNDVYLFLRNLFRQEHYFYRILDLKNDLETFTKIFNNLINCKDHIQHLKKAKIFLSKNLDKIFEFYSNSVNLFLLILSIFKEENIEKQKEHFKNGNQLFLNLNL
jgi:Na+/phosphate symporter